MNNVDKKYQAEDDARILMRAEEIKSDKARLKLAIKVLKEQAEHNKRVLKANS